ncbi:MAG TPA: ParB/RepB/Spo0J family partition protein [Pyrinomonadaceae bacterium]|nr:ParB/RepB/Spo0J family partition protein [Pyrinomonadaceae bacterium]
MAKQALGRGLSALLGEDTAMMPGSTPNEIDMDLIEPNPEQPRTRFAEAPLDELAQSIVANGIVQPIVVRKASGRYQIVAGERRWRAAQRAGLRKIPVTIKDVSDEKLLELALIENIQRQELNPIEEGRAYRKLIDTIGLTQEQVSERVGKERTLIATTLRLLKLPSDIQGLIEEGKLSAGHGRALLLNDDVTVQKRVARAIIEKQMSVREAERAMKSAGTANSATGAKRSIITKDANIRSAETKLMRALGTNVKISPNVKGTAGKIEIEYYNLDDLDRLFQILVNTKEG